MGKRVGEITLGWLLLTAVGVAEETLPKGPPPQLAVVTAVNPTEGTFTLQQRVVIPVHRTQVKVVEVMGKKMEVTETSFHCEVQLQERTLLLREVPVLDPGL